MNTNCTGTFDIAKIRLIIRGCIIKRIVDVEEKSIDDVRDDANHTYVMENEEQDIGQVHRDAQAGDRHTEQQEPAPGERQTKCNHYLKKIEDHAQVTVPCVHWVLLAKVLLHHAKPSGVL